MIRTLLSVRLRSVFSSLTSGKKKNGKEKVSKGRIVLLCFLYLYLILVFGGMFTSVALSMALSLIPAGLDWAYLAIFNVIAFGFIFVFSIFETKSELFECKDNDLLLSMPIKPHDIILSRIFTVLVYNYLECALVMLPAIIIYALFGGALASTVGLVLSFILIPLLATSLAAGVGYIVALIAKKTKNNSFLTTAICLIFLGLYFWGCNTLMGTSDEEIDFVGLSNSMKWMKFIGEASMLHPLYTTLFVLITALVSFVCYYLISKSYISIVTASGSSKKKKIILQGTEQTSKSISPSAESVKGKGVYLKSSSQMASLIKKEFSLFFSSANYMLNAGLGLVFTAAVGVIIFINAPALSEVFSEIFGLSKSDPLVSGILAAVLSSAMIFVGSTTTISASALSLEGKRLWIIRSMPISAKTVLLSKTAPAVLLPIIPNLFAAVAIILSVKTGLLDSLLVILVILTAGVASALVGTVFNGAFPKFNYENEAQVVKQSLAVFLTLLVLTLYGLLAVFISFIFSFMFALPTVGMLTVLLLNIAISVSMLLFILGPLSRKYNSLSV